jgi:hypothetical protein
MTQTLEQELEQVIADADYRVVVVHASDRYINLRIVYLPHLSVRGEGAFSYIAHGLIAEQHFMDRNPRKRWRKAREWAQREISGHREFVQGVNIA